MQFSATCVLRSLIISSVLGLIIVSSVLRSSLRGVRSAFDVRSTSGYASRSDAMNCSTDGRASGTAGVDRDTNLPLVRTRVLEKKTLKNWSGQPTSYTFLDDQKSVSTQSRFCNRNLAKCVAIDDSATVFYGVCSS
jgi:hypothetical protein